MQGQATLGLATSRGEGLFSLYHRIMVPLDDTDHSRRALGEAIRIATDANARLRLLFVVEDIHLWDFHLFLHSRRIERADATHVKKLLLVAVDLVRQMGLRVDGVMQFAEGEPVHRLIAREAEAAQIANRLVGPSVAKNNAPAQ